MGSDTERHPKIIAVVGMSGTGKSAVVDIIEEHFGARRVYFGGVVIEELEAAGLAITEDNEAVVRSELRSKLGMAAMAIKRLPQIERALQSGTTVVIDGLYSYGEYRFLQDRFDGSLRLIAVHAPKSLRVLRLAERLVRPLSGQEVERRDRREIESLDKGGPIALADYHLINAGTRAELSNDLKSIMVQECIPSRKVPADEC